MVVWISLESMLLLVGSVNGLSIIVMADDKFFTEKIKFSFSGSKLISLAAGWAARRESKL